MFCLYAPLAVVNNANVTNKCSVGIYMYEGFSARNM